MAAFRTSDAGNDMAAKKRSARAVELSPIQSEPHAREIADIEGLRNERNPAMKRTSREVETSGATGMDVVQLLADLQDDVFDDIRELRLAEDRPGLTDDEEDAANAHTPL